MENEAAQLWTRKFYRRRNNSKVNSKTTNQKREKSDNLRNKIKGGTCRKPICLVIKPRLILRKHEQLWTCVL